MKLSIIFKIMTGNIGMKMNRIKMIGNIVNENILKRNDQSFIQ